MSQLTDLLQSQAPKAKTKPAPPPTTTVPAKAVEPPLIQDEPLEYSLRRLRRERVGRFFSLLSGGFGLNMLFYVLQHDRMILVPVIGVALTIAMAYADTRSVQPRLQIHGLICTVFGICGYLLAMPIATAVARMANNV